jgi:hypothetical protein
MEETDVELPLRNDNQEDTDDQQSVTDNPVDTQAESETLSLPLPLSYTILLQEVLLSLFSQASEAKNMADFHVPNACGNYHWPTAILGFRRKFHPPGF